ncbi:MAG: nicotinate-nucleotide adenylyltransferase [Chlamydiae bacterium]|nr:nicotinate-nucleotide adenylyltransferase [Chlamydiota bacterium]MBI3266713.1 nicotinate-nucleotide adenylyltransferase [Chlamydiota bacterium]
MRIGLFGGTFDSIHVGHLILAEHVRQKMALDKVIFIPSASPPHKKGLAMTPAPLRLKMVELAIEGNAHFRVSRIELDRSSLSYSMDTVVAFKKKYPQHSFFFIVGSDSLFKLYTWYGVEKLIKLSDFIVATRPGFSLRNVSAKKLRLSEKAFQKVTRYCVRMPEIGISSTQIRKRVAEGLSVRYLVPEKVQKFIERMKLYRKGDYHRGKSDGT